MFSLSLLFTFAYECSPPPPPSTPDSIFQPHGRAWKVLNKKLLIDDVIPKFFGQSKYASFTRQLSGWGFKRLHQTGPDFGCYYHECFLRGHPRLTILMRRMSSGKGKATPNTLSEPDFYAIAKQYPLRATGKEPIYSLEDDKKTPSLYGSHLSRLLHLHRGWRQNREA